MVSTAHNLSVGDLVKIGRWSPTARRAALSGKIGLVEQVTPLMGGTAKLKLVTVLVEGERISFFDHELLAA